MPITYCQPAGKQPIEDEQLLDHSFDNPEVNQSAPNDQDWTTLPRLPPRGNSPLTHHSSTQSLESLMMHLNEKGPTSVIRLPQNSF